MSALSALAILASEYPSFLISFEMSPLDTFRVALGLDVFLLFPLNLIILLIFFCFLGTSDRWKSLFVVKFSLVQFLDGVLFILLFSADLPAFSSQFSIFRTLRVWAGAISFLTRRELRFTEGLLFSLEELLGREDIVLNKNLAEVGFLLVGHSVIPNLSICLPVLVRIF
jgi:hypothetical protein